MTLISPNSFKKIALVAWGIVFLFSTSLSSQVPSGAPAAPLIKEIDVQFVGFSSMSRERVLDNLATKVDQPFNDHLVEEDVKALYATGEVSNARIFAEPIEGGLKVTVLLQGRPKIEEVLIEGASAIPASKIRKEISTKPGDAFSEEHLADDRQKILKLYEDRNYTDVQVEATSSEMGSKRMRVIFRINEGPKLIVKEIRFVGNYSIQPKDLMKVMKTKTANILSFLTKNGRLLPNDIEEDQELIRTLYQNRGFADAKVTDVQSTPNEKNGLTLTITVKEGPQYRVRRLKIEGMNIAPASILENEMKMKSGSLYTPEGMGADLKKIREFYGSRGYVDMVIQPQITPVTETQIDLIYHLEEGMQSYLNLVTIQGNTRTKDKVIRREMVIQPGGIYNTTAVDLSKTRLMNLNYFSKVDCVPEDTLIPGRKDLKVIVEEKKTGALHFGAGFNTIDSLIGFAELEQSNFDLLNWPNFTGGGERFRTRVQYGIQRKDFTASLTEPWFLGYKVSVGGEVYYHEASFLSPVYNQSNWGGALQVRKEIVPCLAGSLEYRPEQISIFNVQSNSVPANSPIQSDANNSPYFKSAILASLNWDTRDNLFLPRKGHQVDFTFFGAGGGLGGNVQDYGITLEGKKYFSLPWDMIFLTKGSIAAVNSWSGGSKGVGTPPIFDELYLGGANNLRGFFFRQVSPVDGNNNPIGGNSSAYMTGELTIPIITRVRAAIFSDWGLVNAGSYDYSTVDACGDIGIGVRLELPIGPVNIDWGYPVKYQSYNKSNGQFNFTVGYQF
ncbi:MAG: outer membrane protein assembly factor BamA [Verrucomicrobia bacterium]|nr:MAG: outer membrane protein assembly factor BamA [Verrucomicrobiota bacterium]